MTTPSPDRADPRGRRASSRRALAACAAAVAALHLALLAEAPRQPDRAPQPRVLTVRQIVADAAVPARPPAGAIAPALAPAAAALPAVSPARRERMESEHRRPPPESAAPAPLPAAAPVPALSPAKRERTRSEDRRPLPPSALAAPAPAGAALPAASPAKQQRAGGESRRSPPPSAARPTGGPPTAVAAANPDTVGAGNGTDRAADRDPPDPPAHPAHPGDTADATARAAPPPVYPVRLPASATWRWQRLRGGAAADEITVDWRADNGAYRLTIADAAGDGWASRGAVGAHGIEPERLVERRRGRDVRAANFRRDIGRVSYSGPAIEHPLWPGAQDRASWPLQLAGVVAATPERFAAPDAAVDLFVVGARGDAALWRFVVEAVEPLQLPAGPVPAALRLAREPAQRYEPRLEVWLDPTRGHLPVRWRSRVAETGESVDHRLSRLPVAP